VWRSAAEPQPTRLVGAPLVGALVEGTHEGCPYETRELSAKKTRIYGFVSQTSAFGLRLFLKLTPPNPRADIRL
jgi:hypothetical protein